MEAAWYPNNALDKQPRIDEENYMNLPDAPVPEEGLCVTHFMTVNDQVKLREFCADILGGRVCIQPLRSVIGSPGMPGER